MPSPPPARHRTRTLAAAALLATACGGRAAPSIAVPALDVPALDASPIDPSTIVRLGDGLPAATFDDTLAVLRYYTAPSRLDALRRTPPAERAAAWAAFLVATDPDPATPAHEGLQRYVARLAIAAARYHDDGGPDGLSDRGMVFAALGDPDEVLEPARAGLADRERVQVWVYRARRVRIEFRDRAGFGRWLLTPRAQVEFVSVLTRLHP